MDLVLQRYVGIPNNWSGSQIPSSGTVYFPNGKGGPISVTLDGNQSAAACR